MDEITIFGTVSLILLVIAFSVVIYFKSNTSRKMKKEAENFLKTHPESAIVYGKFSVGATTQNLSILEVNGKDPVYFSDGKNWVYYILPGENSLKVSYNRKLAGVSILSEATANRQEETIKIRLEPKEKYQLEYKDEFLIKKLEE